MLVIFLLLDRYQGENVLEEQFVMTYGFRVAKLLVFGSIVSQLWTDRIPWWNRAAHHHGDPEAEAEKDKLLFNDTFLVSYLLILAKPHLLNFPLPPQIALPAGDNVFNP